MGKSFKLLLLFFLCILLIPGCATTVPKEAMSLSPVSLEQRQIQTRKYETNDEEKILIACAGLLQDMGFNIDESETELGVIVGSKMRSAVNVGQQIAAVLAAAFTGVVTPTNKEQKMRASVVTKPIGENGEYTAVRVTFQRIVWNTSGQVTILEGLTDPEIYQEFFDKLSKAIFLEAHEI